MNVNLNKNGFTLIELLVSMIILIIISLALLQSIVFFINYNLENSLRDIAIKISQSCIEDLRNLQKCTSSGQTNGNDIIGTLKVNLRNFTKDFTIKYPNPDNFSPGPNSVTITVSYSFPEGSIHEYSISTTIYKNE